MQAVGMSITNAVSDETSILNHDVNPFHQEMYIRDLNFEFEILVSTEDVDSVQAATATLHKVWLDIKSVDIRGQKSLSNLFFRKGKFENEKILKAQEAFENYCKQGEPRKSDHQTLLIQIYKI